MSTRQITIRDLGYSDLPQVIAIERRAFPTPWSLAMFVLELSKSSSICLAAVSQSEVSAGVLEGYVICSRYAGVWHVMNIAVDPPLRRHGIGTALLEALVARAGPEQEYTLEVRPSNEPAIRLYERFGFRRAGTRPRYYHDTGEDAVIMWRVPELAPPSEASP
jgi:ribosomal-protein-alanine N-acetyltransferase